MDRSYVLKESMEGFQRLICRCHQEKIFRKYYPVKACAVERQIEDLERHY